VDGVHLNLAKL